MAQTTEKTDAVVLAGGIVNNPSIDIAVDDARGYIFVRTQLEKKFGGKR
ncbi:MAG: hypothetical protein WDA20_14845 [Desulfuromonadales bacterium]